MIDKPTRIGNTELYIVRVQNINVAQSYNVFWEYVEILNKAKTKYKKQLETKNNYKLELKIIFECKKQLHDLIYNQETKNRGQNNV